MRNELVPRPPQMVGTEQDQTLQTLALHGLYEPLGERIHVRCMEGGGDDFDAGILEDSAELRGELAVAVEDQELFVAQAPVDAVGEVARDLRHERAVGIRVDARDLDHAARVVQHEEHVCVTSPRAVQTSTVKKSAPALPRDAHGARAHQFGEGEQISMTSSISVP